MTPKSLFYDWFVAGRYDGNLAEITQEYRSICIDRIGIKEGDVVLDLGCGTGLNQPESDPAPLAFELGLSRGCQAPWV